MRRLVRRVDGAWRARLGEDQESFKAAIVLLIAVMTFLTTVLAALQVDAGARAATAGRRADAVDAAATGRRSEGLIQTNSDLGVYRRWIELYFDMAWASGVLTDEVAGPAEGEGADPGDARDPELDAEIARIDRELADWARQQSPLLLPPYFDESTTQTDIARLDAERNIGPQARATHERRIALAEASDWGSRAADYVTTITLVAVGLFFLGLAAAMAGTARRILAVAGTAFGLVALVSGTAIALRPVERVPTEAVDALVAAEMSLARVTWSSSDGDVTETERATYESAVEAADEGFARAPAYPPARAARAEARVHYASALLFSEEPDPATAGPLLDAALDDFRAATAADDSSYRTWWNFGWAAYLAGDYGTSIEATNRALDLAPDQFTLYLTRALARLAGGTVEAARADVSTALEVAGRSRLDSNGWFFAQTDYNLSRLAAARPNEAGELLAIRRRVREAAVTSRVSRPSPPDDAAVERLEVRTLSLERARLVDGVAIADGARLDQTGVAGFRLVLAATSIPEGAILSVRVHEGGLESPEYRIDRPWPDTPAQTSVDLVSPYGRMGYEVDPGEYEVEVFVDGRTVAARSFRVEASTALGMTRTQFATFLGGGGMTCGQPVPTGDRTTTTCLTTGATRDTGMEAVIRADASDAIRGLELSTGDIEPARPLVRQMVGLVAGVLFDEAETAEVEAWVAEAEPGRTTTIGGWVFSVTDAGQRFAVRVTGP